MEEIGGYYYSLFAACCIPYKRGCGLNQGSQSSPNSPRVTAILH